MATELTQKERSEKETELEDAIRTLEGRIGVGRSKTFFSPIFLLLRLKKGITERGGLIV